MENIIIYETNTFEVIAPKFPHIPREDGGHIIIRSKKKFFNSRLDFTSDEAIEMMRLSMIVGKAYMNALNINGIKVERLNYQENGNWSYLENTEPFFHLHIYGRTRTSKTQRWGEALLFPDKRTSFYDGFSQVSTSDIEEIKKQISIIENEKKYNIKNW